MKKYLAMLGLAIALSQPVFAQGTTYTITSPILPNTQIQVPVPQSSETVYPQTYQMPPTYQVAPTYQVPNNQPYYQSYPVPTTPVINNPTQTGGAADVPYYYYYYYY